MRHYGLIGKTLDHSLSEQYFTDKFRREKIDADYRLLPMASLEELHRYHLDGYNVTIPYKQEIITHLDGLSEAARQIGAVNVVAGGRGYNTDHIGFRRSIEPLLLPHDTRALVLGTGGAARAIQYALEQMGITYTRVSRTAGRADMTYEQLDEEIMHAHSLIIHCTPLGTYPNTEDYPALPYQYLTAQHLLFDCVYNPEKTRFLSLGQQHGARIKNGLEMLYIQAEESWKIWNQQI